MAHTYNDNTLNVQSGRWAEPSPIYFTFRKIQIATSWKQHFLSSKLNSEHTFQFKLYLKTWGNLPQEPLMATQKYFLGNLLMIFSKSCLGLVVKFVD